jgi:hypothetical protein
MSQQSDPIDGDAARRNSRRLLQVSGGLVLLCVAAGGVAGGLRDHSRSAGPAQHGPWLLILFLIVLVVLPLGAGGAVLVRLMRRPSFQRVMQYGWSERRRTFKNIKAGRPLDERQARIARAPLDYTERQRWFLWLLSAAICIWLLNGFTHRDDGWGKVQLGLGVLYLLGLPVMFWQRRRALERTRHALDRAQPS